MTEVIMEVKLREQFSKQYGVFTPKKFFRKVIFVTTQKRKCNECLKPASDKVISKFAVTFISFLRHILSNAEGLDQSKLNSE
jgi:hypothetical protein